MLVRSLYRPLIWLTLAVVLALGALLLVTVRKAHAVSEPPALLPNLVADPPDTISLETSTTEGGLSQQGEAQLLLRFDGYVHNDGKGALDIRGSRAAPTISAAAEAEVERRKKELQEIEEGKRLGEPQEFSEATERELASPQMQVFQRLFATNAGAPSTNPEESKAAQEKFDKENEAYLKREPHKEALSSAEMLYANADGHHHWHLQHVAKYSLWNATKTAIAAPAEKVGFCLDDSEHVEPEVGPPNRVYSDHAAPFRDFCQHYIPYATSVYEGISPGWRDQYSFELAFQWVNVSDVPPGEYWLGEEVNPEHTIQEEGLGAKVAYAEKPTIIPGFDALAQSLPALSGAQTITLTARAWEDSVTPKYTIVSGPQHGTLGAVAGDRVTYTPEAGYSGSDSFTYSAADPNSPFPISPVIATVAIGRLAIGGAPASMYAGTSVQLAAAVGQASSAVEWSASAGTITSGGLYTAPSTPPAGGSVTITASSANGAQDQVMIAILPQPVPQAAPAASTPQAISSPPSGKSSPSSPVLYRPAAVLIGRKLIMTTRASVAGRIRLSAYLGHRLLGTCVAETPAGRSFTCRLTLGKRVSLHARISVLASLRTGGGTLRSLRPPAPVPEMKMTGTHARSQPGLARKSSASASFWQLWCSPSMGM